MRLRNWFLVAVGLYFSVQVVCGLCEWNYQRELAAQIGAPAGWAQTCALGESPMSVAGQPPECMTGAEYDVRESAERAIQEGSAPELLAVLKAGCVVKGASACEEMIYLERRLQQ